MKIQLEFNDTKNFTGRARIRQKEDLFSLHLVERLDSTARIRVEFDRRAIEKDCKLNDSDAKDYVLDVFYLGDIYRHILPEYRPEDIFDVPNVPDGANLEFRLKIVSRSAASPGKILAATGGRVSLRIGAEAGQASEQQKGIFHPIPTDSIGSNLWSVVWDNQDDFSVFVNRTYFQKYSDNPIFAAHVFPEVLRNVASGILLRFNSVSEIADDTLARKWVTFIQQRLGIPLEGEEGSYLKDADNATKLDLVDQIVDAFTSNKWRDGKTLLEEIL